MVGLDVTCNNLKLVELKKKGSKFLVNKAACLSFSEELIKPSFINSNINSLQDLSEQITAVYEKAGINKSTCSLSLPSACVRLFFMHFDKISSNSEEMKELIRWQISKQLPRTDFEAVLSYTEIEDNSQDGHELMVVVASQSVINEYQQLLNTVKKRPGRIEVNFLAAYNYFEEYLPENDNYLFVYASHDATSLLFFQAGKPLFSHRIDQGGRDYTLAIARKNDISLSQATIFKSSEPFFPDLNSSDPKIMDNFALIKDVNESLFKKIYDSIRYFLNISPQHEINRVFLCGEGLAFANVALFGENFLGISCEWLAAEMISNSNKFDLNYLYPAIGTALGAAK